ncbi:MAG TPA: hypothetical protein EYP60_05905 [bacterium (Candidatus Stahlbacteria)]|nr:hypothetical protein [Candidatus Stahlbacteria bacterium]
MPRTLKSERGISLVLVLGVMAILGMLAATLIIINLTQSGVASYIRWREIAFNAAEAGVDLGISRIPISIDPFPTPPAIWDTLANGALYKSGASDSVATPIEVVKLYKPEPGYNIKFVFNTYKVCASGKADRVHKIIEAGVRCGPLTLGTSY